MLPEAATLSSIVLKMSKSEIYFFAIGINILRKLQGIRIGCVHVCVSSHFHLCSAERGADVTAKDPDAETVVKLSKISNREVHIHSC